MGLTSGENLVLPGRAVWRRESASAVDRRAGGTARATAPVARPGNAHRWRSGRTVFILGFGASVAVHAAALFWLSLPPSSLDVKPRARPLPAELPVLTAVRLAEPVPPAAPPPDAPRIEVPATAAAPAATAAVPSIATPIARPMVAGRADTLALAAPVAAAPALADPVARGQYEQQIARWVERHREYPLAARQRRLEGTAVVRLRLDVNGSLLQAQLVRDTGHTALDRAALGMVQRAAPFPRVPATLSDSPVEILVPIQFLSGG